jgi:hypothetical protein
MDGRENMYPRKQFYDQGRFAPSMESNGMKYFNRSGRGRIFWLRNLLVTYEKVGPNWAAQLVCLLRLRQSHPEE